jgi:electron transport complex protein RnfG
MLRSSLLLGLFALVATGLVALIHAGTAEHIAESERAYMLRSLHAVIDPASHNNDLFSDVIVVQTADYLGSNHPLPVFRARRDGQPVALAITTFAPDGYVGPIKLLVGIDFNGTLTGVRVLSHQETPGLGDAIDARRSDWIFGFNGRSLDNPTGNKGWQVRRDGGDFDQFTGATITPRAIVKAVHQALKFFAQNRNQLFSQPAQPHQMDEQHEQQ